MEFVLVLTTYPADGDADAFARTLVDERLAACVSVLPPMQSIYRWKGSGGNRHRTAAADQDKGRQRGGP